MLSQDTLHALSLLSVLRQMDRNAQHLKQFAEEQLSLWTTIGGHAEGGKKHVGGTHVKVDSGGRIAAGPAPLKGKTLGELKKGAEKKSDKPVDKPEPLGISSHRPKQERPMSSVLITGNTFPVKDKLREMGGRWDGAAKGWRVPADKAEEAKTLVGPTPLYNSPPPRDLGTVDPAASATKFGRTAKADAKVRSFDGEGNRPEPDGTVRTIDGRRYVQLAHSQPRYLSREFLEDTDEFGAAPGYRYQWDGVEVEATDQEKGSDRLQRDAAEKAKQAKEDERQKKNQDWDSGRERIDREAQKLIQQHGLVKAGEGSNLPTYGPPVWSDSVNSPLTSASFGASLHQAKDGSFVLTVGSGDREADYRTTYVSPALAKESSDKKRVWQWWRPDGYGADSYPGPGVPESELTEAEKAEVARRYAAKYAAKEAIIRGETDIDLEYCDGLKPLLAIPGAKLDWSVDEDQLKKFVKIMADTGIYSDERKAAHLDVHAKISLPPDNFAGNKLKPAIAKKLPVRPILNNRYKSVVLEVTKA